MEKFSAFVCSPMFLYGDDCWFLFVLSDGRWEFFDDMFEFVADDEFLNVYEYWDELRFVFEKVLIFFVLFVFEFVIERFDFVYFLKEVFLEYIMMIVYLLVYLDNWWCRFAVMR